MPAKRKTRIHQFFPYIRRFFFWGGKGIQSHVDHIHQQKTAPLEPARQAELEKLCNELFKKRDLVTSGKLQFIGLARIKKRMGRKWAGLSKIVYETAEEVIQSCLEKGDIYIRYRDESYVIIFCRASLEEGRLRAALIAEKIRERLFALDEKELRSLEIRRALTEIRTDMLADLEFPEMLDYIDCQEEVADEKEEAALDVSAIEIDPERFNPYEPALDNSSAVSRLVYRYLPLWDTRKGALTTYLYLAQGPESKEISLNAHEKFCRNLQDEKKFSLDLDILSSVSSELAHMEQDGRKLFIVCPVQHATLFHYKNYAEFKRHLMKIPGRQRQFLILLVMQMEKASPKDPYWFASPLRQLCRNVFAEIPLRRDINFNYLRNTGIEVAGVRIGPSENKPEQELISLLNVFSARAKVLKISQTFLLDVSTLSLTTSAVCAGFNFIGGPAIHAIVEKPDVIYRYQHENLLHNLRRA